MIGHRVTVKLTEPTPESGQECHGVLKEVADYGIVVLVQPYGERAQARFFPMRVVRRIDDEGEVPR